MSAPADPSRPLPEPTTRPRPEPDERSAPFWAAAADHVLTLARCGRCRAWTLPPGVVCAHCGTTDPGFAFAPVSPHGTVCSWTVVRQAFLPGFDDDLPFVLVDAEIADTGVRLIGRLLDGVEAPLRVGDAVEVAWEDVAPGVAVPAFVLAAP
jgi:uncharacterized OB-fold protein